MWLLQVVSHHYHSSVSGDGCSPPNNVKTVFQLWPRFIAAANRRTSSTVLQASTPSHIMISIMVPETPQETYHGQIARPKVHFDGFFVCISCSEWQPVLCHRSSLRLCSIHCIKCLIQEKPNGPRSIYPRRHILIERRIVP